MFHHNEVTETDDEDEIIEEIPVYLSQHLLNNLCVFQYPNKSHLNNYDNTDVVEAKVKPVNKEVKLSMSLNTESPYYDNFKGKQFAENAKVDDKVTYKRAKLDRHELHSSNAVTDLNKYMAGIYAEHELHLTPLAGILQLRSSFDYIDKGDKRSKECDKSDEGTSTEDEELQAVTVKFAKPSGPSAKKSDKKRSDNLEKRTDDEPWVESEYHKKFSKISELERQRLFSNNQDISSIFSQDSTQYLQKLLPREKTLRQIDQLLPSRIMTKYVLSTLPLVEQLKHILKDGKLQRFQDIVKFVQVNFDKTVTPDKIVRLLPQVGVLIHGNWCVQSEILYPNDTFSSINGVSAEHMARARNFVLHRFLKTPYLNRCQIAAATGLKGLEILEVLESVARLNKDLRWELLLPPDREFEQQYPEQVTRQKVNWNAQIQRELEQQRRVRNRSSRESTSKTAVRLENRLSESNSTTTTTTTNMINENNS